MFRPIFWQNYPCFKEIVSIVEAYCWHFYIRDNRCASLYDDIFGLRGWKRAEINGQVFEQNSILVEKWRGKACRLVILCQRWSDGDLDIWEGEYICRCILINDFESSTREIVEFYKNDGRNQDGSNIVEQKKFEILVEVCAKSRYYEESRHEERNVYPLPTSHPSEGAFRDFGNSERFQINMWDNDEANKHAFRHIKIRNPFLGVHIWFKSVISNRSIQIWSTKTVFFGCSIQIWSTKAVYSGCGIQI